MSDDQQRQDDETKNDGAGLIHQIASPLAETLPRPTKEDFYWSCEDVRSVLRLAERSNKDWRWALDRLDAVPAVAETEPLRGHDAEPRPWENCGYALHGEPALCTCGTCLTTACLRYVCAHARRTGGNDYLFCGDCGLEWDWRLDHDGKKTALQYLIDTVGASPHRSEAPKTTDSPRPDVAETEPRQLSYPGRAPVVDAHVHGQEDQGGHVPHGGRGDLGPADRPELSHVAIRKELAEWLSSAVGPFLYDPSQFYAEFWMRIDRLIAAVCQPQPAWQSIETAPKDGTPIIVLTELGNIIKAETSDVVTEDGWAWVASNEDVHPPCWTDGVCWAENADYEPSDPPRFWMPLPPSPKE